mgnify:CR=1 FL=1
MSRIECPSKSWDRYCDAQEEAEACPHCGKAIFDEEGEPFEAFKAFHPCCSEDCNAKHNEMLRLESEAEIRMEAYLREMEELVEKFWPIK